jgi:UDP-glucose:(heptosyl)LPS alpha-1,3-glucosyltransferase
LSALRAQGTDVTIIARKWVGETGPGFLRCNPFYLGRTWRDAGFTRAVQEIIASGGFDLVQSHERIPGCHIYRAGDGVHATWLELRNATRGPAARLATALSPWHRRTLAAEAAMFRHPALRAVICNSAMVRDDIARRFGLAPEKLHVIHNGVDPAQFHPGLRAEHRERMRTELRIPEGAPVILFVGSGFERKGVFTLLRALAGMETDEAHLVVVGKDRHQTLAGKLAQTLGIDERVRFIGGQKDVRPYYGMADAFCLPTLYDPMPNAALEALACGLPTIVTTDCGARELIEEGVNGHIVRSGDAGQLAERLDAVCAHGLSASAGPARLARAYPTAEDMSIRLLGLYRGLLGI